MENSLLIMFGLLALLVAALVIVSGIKMSRKINNNTVLLDAHRESKEKPGTATSSKSEASSAAETEDIGEEKTAGPRNFKPSG